MCQMFLLPLLCKKKQFEQNTQNIKGFNSKKIWFRTKITSHLFLMWKTLCWTKSKQYEICFFFHLYLPCSSPSCGFWISPSVCSCPSSWLSFTLSPSFFFPNRCCARALSFNRTTLGKAFPFSGVHLRVSSVFLAEGREGQPFRSRTLERLKRSRGNTHAHPHWRTDPQFKKKHTRRDSTKRIIYLNGKGLLTCPVITTQTSVSGANVGRDESEKNTSHSIHAHLFILHLIFHILNQMPTFSS